MEKELVRVFRKGSKTFFNSSLFFPKKVREEVFELYGFIRTADDLVDALPQDVPGYYAFKESYLKAVNGTISDNPLINIFVDLCKRKHFDPDWVTAFFKSMEMDLTKKKYHSLEETLEYLYGTAEVIGLTMAVIMGLDRRAWPAAQMLGRSLQYINFIRDIAEDVKLGRTYLPLKDTPFSGLSQQEVEKDPEAFKDFIHKQAGLYLEWHKQAEAGYAYIPYRSLIAIKTAADMYIWTARVIQRDPFVVYHRKVKPSRARVLLGLIKNSILLIGKKYA